MTRRIQCVLIAFCVVTALLSGGCSSPRSGTVTPVGMEARVEPSATREPAPEALITNSPTATYEPSSIPPAASATFAASATPVTRNPVTRMPSVAPVEGETPLPSPTPSVTAFPIPALVKLGDATQGRQVFHRQHCNTCHSTQGTPPPRAVGPSLTHIATGAKVTVASPDYHGAAQDAPTYIYESIVNPNAYIVPGLRYRRTDGSSLMPGVFSELLTPTEIDDLVGFLMTLD